MPENVFQIFAKGITWHHKCFLKVINVKGASFFLYLYCKQKWINKLVLGTS